MTKRKTVKRAGRKIPQPKPESNGQLIDGTITIEVKGGPHDGEKIHMDATVVKLAAEQLQAKHKLPIEDGGYRPTAEFAVDLDKALQGVGYKSTATIAIHAWIRASEYFVELQKKTS